MAQTRIRENDGVVVFPRNDPFGRRSIAGSNELVTERRTKRWHQASAHYFHRTKNGVHDPYSFFHIAQALANIRPWQPFTAAELSEHLNQTVPAFIWDSVTVGRILADMIESFQEANGNPDAQPIKSMRHWNGTYYEMSEHPAARAAILNLVDDLLEVADSTRDSEARGIKPPRLTSPLLQCPSLLILDAVA